MKSLKILFDKKLFWRFSPPAPTLDALITYVALKSFPGHLEEGNRLLARLIDRNRLGMGSRCLALPSMSPLCRF